MSERGSELRERIVRAAAELLATGGRDAVSTRAVSAAAGVQAPAIYRQFGDMRALLQAAAEATLAEYVQKKKVAHARATDPVEELRRGWDQHVAFGLANPAAYTLLYAETPADGATTADGLAVLHGLVTRVAEAGRLRMPVDQAVKLIHAGGLGVTLSLIAAPAESRDLRVSDAMRDAVLDTVLTPQPSKRARDIDGEARVATRAIALRAILDEAPPVLTSGERGLLAEWLDRLSNDDDALTKRPRR